VRPVADGVLVFPAREGLPGRHGGAGGCHDIKTRPVTTVGPGPLYFLYSTTE